MTRKLEGGISIVDWGGNASPAPLVNEVRGLLEANDVSGILVDMRSCDELLADHLEALTEANRVCRDRNCRIGLFGVNDRLARLVDVSGLREEVPDLLNGDEQQVITAFRNGSQLTTASPELEFEIDLDSAPTSEAMTAPTARFDSATVSSEPYSPTDDPRDGATQVYGAPPQAGRSQADEELLAVYWADLAATGYVIGGDASDRIMNAVATGPRSQPTEPPEEGVIDLGDAAPAKREFKTQMLPAFDLSGSSEEWSAAPSGALEVDFGAAGGALAPQAGGVFAGPGEAEFSPVDSADAGPPAAVLQARAQQQQPAGEIPDDGDATVMFQPGALDEALRQAGMAAAAAAAPVGPPESEIQTPITGVQAIPLPAQAEESYGDDSDQTVMFQPGALDMALLAEVAAAAGPEQQVTAPPVEPVPAAPQPAVSSVPDGTEVEVRLFMHDFAISSNLHLQVLDRFVKADADILGKTDLQVATGGTRGQVIEIVDQFVQSRLVRRMRSPRIRGGSGFMFSPSPATRNTVTRLLKMWQNPQQRQKVAGWLRGG